MVGLAPKIISINGINLLPPNSECAIACTETQLHVLCCKHPNRQANYKILIQPKHHLLSSHVMPRLCNIFTKYLAYSLGYVPEPTTNILLMDGYSLKLFNTISEQWYIVWPNAMKGLISPMWGKLKSDYYCEKYPDPNDRPKHLSDNVFKMKIIQSIWIMFQFIWRQGNNNLNNEVEGANVITMVTRLKRIYTYKTHYI